MVEKVKEENKEAEKVVTPTIKELAGAFVVQGQQQVFLEEAVKFFQAINEWALNRNISFEQALGTIASLYPFDLEAKDEKEKD